LQESYELSESLEANEHLPPQDRKWWILKPGMSDRGQGIRLFSTMQELRGIFESWEVDSDAEEEEEEDGDGDGVMTSQLRHFVAQSYIHPPLLVSGRKFHIRTYVLAVGGLRVYVYKQMLALFAETPYSPPWKDPRDLASHLTNTCRQSGERVGSVRLFWEETLQKEIGQGVGDRVWRDICAIVKEVFEAAARGMRVHFQVSPGWFGRVAGLEEADGEKKQTLPNAFELFGVDFMVSETGTTSLLEVNAYPDFKQTGEELGRVIEGLLEDTVKAAIVPFLTGKKKQPEEEEEEGGGLEKVLDISVGAF
jgi:tubulin--tyrosine ligase